MNSFCDVCDETILDDEAHYKPEFGFIKLNKELRKCFH